MKAEEPSPPLHVSVGKEQKFLSAVAFCAEPEFEKNKSASIRLILTFTLF
jgi:hypothetical protein